MEDDLDYLDFEERFRREDIDDMNRRYGHIMAQERNTTVRRTGNQHNVMGFVYNLDEPYDYDWDGWEDESC